jgi:6-phosphogluconolactonase
MARLTVARDKPAMSAVAAERVTSLIEAAIGERGSAAVSLTGGSTPDVLYEYLADSDRRWRSRIDWRHVHLFWSDEREVPPDDAQSNFGLAHRLLIRHVAIPDVQIHRMRGELPASDAGRLYDSVLRVRRDQIAGPLFDVMLLGIGQNAHIASLFPESPLLRGGADPPGPVDRLASGVAVPVLSQWRITMTPAALLDSAVIIAIANGTSKADAMAAAIDHPADVARYPAQLLRAAGDRVEWIIDSAAGARLRDVPPG